MANAESLSTPEVVQYAMNTAPHSEGGIHIALAAERLGYFFGVPITNTLITSWIVMFVLLTLGVIIGRRAKMLPSRPQLLFEMIFEYAYDFMARILESRDLARRFFPFLMTIFLFIFFSNVLEFTPGIGSIKFTTEWGEKVSFLRAVNSDLNVTLALTILTVIVIEFAGVYVLGFFRYGSKFINFSSPLKFAVGLIELVSEAGRLISFSFRLFGNIFAGKVLLAVVVFFVPYLLPVPVMAFELFVGFIQAVVFAMLALFFIKMAITDTNAHH